MKAKDNKKTPRRRTAAGRRSREAARLEKLYRELGFVYSGTSATFRINESDRSLAPVDFRPRVELSFSAISAP